MSPRSLRLLGIVALGLGFVLIISGFLLWVTFTPPSIFTNDFQTVSAATSAAFARTAILLFVGFILTALGGAALWFGSIRPVSSFVAREASPAIGIVAESAAEGVAGGLAMSPGIPVRVAERPAETVVKVKCKACGYLDSEDATYCSRCGKPL